MQLSDVADVNPPGNSEEGGRVHIGLLPPITMIPGGSTRLSRAGMSWFVAQLVFAGGDLATKSALYDKLDAEVNDAKKLLESDDRFAEFTADPANHLDYLTSLADQDSSPNKWAALFVIYGSALLDADDSLDDELRQVVVWRLANIRTMLLFTSHIEELAWRGYQNFGADVLAEALTAWRDSDKNEPEAQWQAFLEDRPYLISLIFPGPVAIHQGKAYLGGKKVDNTGGKIVGFPS